jgi:hypothetical protein
VAWEDFVTSKPLEADALRRILKRAVGQEVTWQEIDQVKDHITALEADNGALLEALRGIVDHTRISQAFMSGNHRYSLDGTTESSLAVGRARIVVNQPHPGAQTLEEHRKALIARSNLEEANASLHEQLAQMERGHAKALIRARNEGLEKAAQWHDDRARKAREDAHLERGQRKERWHQEREHAAKVDEYRAKELRAMKEPE